MKTKFLRDLLFGLVIICGQLLGSQNQVLPQESTRVQQFLKEHFSRGTLPPISFSYDGRFSSSFIKTWKFTSETRTVDENRAEQTNAYTDPRTGLIVRATIVIYKDYPAVEWVLKFKNSSRSNTPIIENIKALETDFENRGKGDFVLHRALGSNAERSDFAPIDEVLESSGEVTFGPLEGRSSGNGALPFFNLEASEEGIMVGIGWTGKWRATVRRNRSGPVLVSAGMEKTHFRLYPQEEVRSPRVVLLFWSGSDRMRGHNLFRKFILKHHAPQKDGRPMSLPLASGLGFGGPRPCNEYSCATESYAIAMAYRLNQFGLLPEAGWIDAGWFEGSELSWAQGVGNWFVNKRNFPNGIRPVSEAAKKLGMGFVLWFEPERVYKGTWLAQEHPDWLIKRPDLSENDKLFIDPAKNYLLNLGLPAARRWLADHISGMIEREGITIYRQDFNFDPQEYWRLADAPDRQGITEIKHIEGLYEFWDELLARHPGLLIDNCASGGRRLDLETISRSAPLWRTDYQYYEPNGYQCHTYGINFYLPMSGTGNNNPEPYTWRSALSSALVFGWDLNPFGFPLEQAKKSIEEFKKLRPYFYGDYYPLTPYSTTDDAWMAYEFNRPAEKDGIALAFRRHHCSEESCRIKLCGLAAEAAYEINFEDYGFKTSASGKKLMEEGIDLKIPLAPGSLLITYKALK